MKGINLTFPFLKLSECGFCICMYKDIDKGKRSTVSVRHSALERWRRVRHPEAVGRDSERAPEEMKCYSRHHNSRRMVTSTNFSWSFSIQRPACAFPESHTHLARHTPARVLQRSQLCCYGEAQTWCSCGLGCRWGGLPFSNPETDECLWCQQPAVKTTLFLIQKWSRSVAGSRAFPNLKNERMVCQCPPPMESTTLPMESTTSTSHGQFTHVIIA